jgi:hypothetical protein
MKPSTRLHACAGAALVALTSSAAAGSRYQPIPWPDAPSLSLTRSAQGASLPEAEDSFAGVAIE